MDVIIVGAGPSGSTAARLLAEQGHNVSVFEEHVAVGRPIACTGIVTNALWKFVRKDPKFIINKLDGVRVIAPSKKSVDIPLEETVICREKFDTYLMQEAVRVGARYFTKHKFVELDGNVAIFNNRGKTVKRSFDILIGADGPYSAVARSSGLFKKREYYVGTQATVEGDFDPHWFLTFFGRRSAPGFFAWAVPEGKGLSRVGVATQKHVGKYFDLLRDEFNGKVAERQAGPIPIYNGAREVQKDNIYLVGDAAGVVKNTTGGGIITGIWSANILADCIKSGKDYSKALRPLRRELWLHKKIRSMLDRFSDDEYEQLVDWMGSKKVKDILFSYPREYPSKFLWRLALAQPKLLKFAKYVLA